MQTKKEGPAPGILQGRGKGTSPACQTLERFSKKQHLPSKLHVFQHKIILRIKDSLESSPSIHPPRATFPAELPIMFLSSPIPPPPFESEEHTVGPVCLTASSTLSFQVQEEYTTSLGFTSRTLSLMIPSPSLSNALKAPVWKNECTGPRPVTGSLPLHYYNFS